MSKQQQGRVEVCADCVKVTVPGRGTFRVSGTRSARAAVSFVLRQLQGRGKKPKRGATLKTLPFTSVNPAKPGTFYVSTYCNKAHALKTGRPIKHECRIIPPAALQAERDGDFDRAIAIMQGKPARYTRGRNPRVEFKSGGKMHYFDTLPGDGVFVGPTKGSRGRLTARGYTGGRAVGSASASAFVVKGGRRSNPLDSHKPNCGCFHHKRLRGGF